MSQIFFDKGTVMKLWQSALITALVLGQYACGSSSNPDSSSTKGLVTGGVPITPIMRPLPDIAINPALLQTMRDKNVLQFAQSRMGQKIDYGNCWDLVYQALNYAGARLPFGFENYEFGREISRSQLVPGNMISFREVRIQYPNGYWMSFSPVHVAVVKQINGNVVTVIHQNAPYGSPVREDVIDLGYVTSGAIRYFAADGR